MLRVADFCYIIYDLWTDQVGVSQSDSSWGMLTYANKTEQSPRSDSIVAWKCTTMPGWFHIQLCIPFVRQTGMRFIVKSVTWRQGVLRDRRKAVVTPLVTLQYCRNHCAPKEGIGTTEGGYSASNLQ